MIELREISKWYGPLRALSTVSLTVAPGTALGLIGPNGAGKSTLLRVVCGLSRPDAGEVRLDGKDAVLDPAARRVLGCMPDAPPLFELLTGREQLVWTGGLLGVDKVTSARRIRELSEALEMVEALDRPIAAYSTGMRKKIAFMNALVGNPAILVLDEPFEGVDLLGIYTMKDLLAQLVSEGASLLISSHILPLIEDLCSEFALLHEGGIVLHGDRETLRVHASKIHSQINPRRTDLESVFVDIIAPDRRARRLESIGRR